jgi:GntR family transcriptional regulator
MKRAGLEASSVVKRFEIITAPKWLAERLNIEENIKVLQVDRLRLGDGEPIAYDTSWLPIFYGQLLSEETLREKTIYSILEDDYDIKVTKGCYRMSATTADDELSKALEVPVNTPLFLIDRITYTIGEKPIYYQKRYYRNDQVKYEMTLERGKNDLSKSDPLPLKEFVPVFHSST